MIFFCYCDLKNPGCKLTQYKNYIPRGEKYKNSGKPQFKTLRKKVFLGVGLKRSLSVRSRDRRSLHVKQSLNISKKGSFMNHGNFQINV